MQETETENVPLEEEVLIKVKKRRLAAEADLDPTDAHFAIQLTEEGEVVILSDDSEVSSLHDEEIEQIRKNYLKVERLASCACSCCRFAVLMVLVGQPRTDR